MALQRMITDGPAKWDLAVSIFEGSAQAKNRRPVTFMLAGIGTGVATLLPVFIGSLEREGESGDSWNFGGVTETGSRACGCYNTRTREGWLETFEKVS